MVGIIRNRAAPMRSVVLPLPEAKLAKAARAPAEPAGAPVAAVDISAVAIGSLGAQKDAWTEQAQRVEQEAREKGFEEGRREALKKLEAEWSKREDRLDRVIEAFVAAKTEAAESAQQDAVAIAFEAVTAIVGKRAVSQQLVIETVQRIHQEQTPAAPITVRVHPDDYEALLAEPKLTDLEEDKNLIRLVEDSRVLLGGCIVEAARGSLDARLEKQIERLREVLLSAAQTKQDT